LFDFVAICRFECPDIVGICLSIRNRDDCLSIWNKNASEGDAVRLFIGEKLKEILNLDESTRIEYKYFKLAIQDGSTHRNAKTYVYAAQTNILPVNVLMAPPTAASTNTTS
jgi:translation initiation factor 4E